MPQESETVTGNPEAPQHPQNEEVPKDEVETLAPTVQEDACILKPHVELEDAACSLIRTTPKSPVAEATEDFLLNEKGAYIEVAEPVHQPEPTPITPANSEASEHANSEEPSIAPQVVEVSVYSETFVVEEPEPALNGHSESQEIILEQPQEPVTNGECKWEPQQHVPEPELESEIQQNGKALNGTIANELINEDYKLPDVVEVKKNFENNRPSGQNISHAPPKKGALSTNLDSASVSQAYQDVRFDGSETQWAVFKFEGPTIVTSATGSDFDQFKANFGDDERAFGYIRVQTGDELSHRAKFLLVTWIGPSVSVLKRAKMSIDKALIKDIVSNFAVELQTENIADINLSNFESVLDKAAGAHYGTGVRS